MQFANRGKEPLFLMGAAYIEWKRKNYKSHRVALRALRWLLSVRKLHKLTKKLQCDTLLW